MASAELSRRVEKVVGATKSIRNYLGTLHSIFESARIRPNPVKDARKPKAQDTDPDIRFLTEEELEALLRAVPNDDLGRTEFALAGRRGRAPPGDALP